MPSTAPWRVGRKTACRQLGLRTRTSPVISPYTVDCLGFRRQRVDTGCHKWIPAPSRCGRLRAIPRSIRRPIQKTVRGCTDDGPANSSREPPGPLTAGNSAKKHWRGGEGRWRRLVSPTGKRQVQIFAADSSLSIRVSPLDTALWRDLRTQVRSWCKRPNNRYHFQDPQHIHTSDAIRRVHPQQPAPPTVHAAELWVPRRSRGCPTPGVLIDLVRRRRAYASRPRRQSSPRQRVPVSSWTATRVGGGTGKQRCRPYRGPTCASRTPRAATTSSFSRISWSISLSGSTATRSPAVGCGVPSSTTTSSR